MTERLLGIVALLVIAGSPSCRRNEVLSGAYAGREACAKCHAAETTAWRGSHHDRAMEIANDTTVLGDFGGATFTHFGVTSTFFRKDGKYLVTTDGPDGTLHDYEIAYTFGIDPLQQYLIAFPNGRLQALNVCWDTRPKSRGGQRWFHLYPEEAVPASDVLHWTGIYQNWNFMCAECHSTNVKKGYDAAKDAYRTTWSELDVSCEACHGPGAGHAADPSVALGVRFDERPKAAWRMNAQTGIAARERPRTSHAEVETCGRCHARRGVVSEDYVYGRPLMDTHRVSLLEPGIYHADGQIEEEDYEYGSFLQSKMYAAGVTCTDCHDPHSGKAPAGNLACMTCHAAGRFDTPEHHHHAAGSEAAACATCHMPTTSYMVVHARHDHGFKVPRPDLTAKIGVPNACARCHGDKPLDWSIQAYARWWGTKRTGAPHWGEAIAAGRKDPRAPELARLIEDKSQPAIVRASATLLAEGAVPATFEPIVQALGDSDPLVRDAAVRALSQADPQLRARLLPPLTGDGVRTVRIDAGRALAAVPAGLLGPAQRETAAAALAEWRAAQLVDADRPEAQSNLCILALEQGDVISAEVACRAAIRIAPQIPTVYVNLADVLRAAGRESDCEATLRAGLAVAPDNGALWHALGLSMVRQHRSAEALASLKRAVELAPQDARFSEVYKIAQAELRE